MAALVQQTGVAKPSLFLSFRYSGVSLNPDETKRMEGAVTALCRDAGFAKVGAGMSGEGDSWQEKVAKFAGLVDDANPTESFIEDEDELIRVYPVRTKLSRFLLNDPDEDCFVVLRQPMDSRFTQFSPATRLAIGRLLAKLELPHKRKVTFRFVTTTAGEALLQRYFRRRDGNPPPADEFVKDLGFRSGNYSMTPFGGNPEGLLGKRAPDFTLDALGGGQIHLHEKIRGQVAVITFWGVPCGACCDEAPHLSAIYDRYADRGLAMVAVDAYDEGKDVVERFVRAKGLTHPIALMGKKVAETYAVASYPVTYLVDHTGAVVDYHLGYEPGDEKVLARAVALLLAKRQTANNQR